MKKLILTLCIYIFFFSIYTIPVFAQSADVAKIETFAQSIIQVLVTLSGVVAAVFIVWGGIGYITSSGNPENLEKSKRTIFYAAIGLTITLGAYVISNIVTDLASSAFGSTP
jgi:hypothetical protein